MTAALHLCKTDDLERVLPLMGQFHDEMGFGLDEAHRSRALAPLLGGAPHGAVYLIGPTKAPIGYLVVSFGWSIEFGGLDAMLDEIYLRPSVRSRGIGTEVLHQLMNALREAGVTGLSLEVDAANGAAARFYRKAGFTPRDRYHLMSTRP